MTNSFSNKWRDYRDIIDKLSKLKVQNSLFPNRLNSSEDFQKLRKQLFDDYEGFINANNSINSIVLRTVLINWFKKNCKSLTTSQINDWIDSQDWKSATTVRYIADDIIVPNLPKLCSRNGINLCKQFGDCNHCLNSLVYEIIKNSDRYTHIPNTEENFDIFLNGSTQYLKKEILTQEASDSPIEEIMYQGLKSVAKKYNYKIEREYPVYDNGRLEIRYSLDLVFTDQKGDPILDVECDGLTFHGSYSSMAQDRERDRWLLIRGIPTMRFTSRDIFNDLDSCITQIDYALRTVSKWKRS